MNKAFLLLSFLLVITLKIFAQEAFRVMFYNVENLYDTINNPKTLDDELTPDGHLRWDGYRYQKKLEDVSKVISSIGGKYPPALVGLCEIENKTVADDLTKHSSLARHKYRYVITNSKDARGSNIVLLYQRDQFKLISNKSYTPTIDPENGKTTRDILHVTGQVVNSDTLDIFVCHFPSRNEGATKSEPYRIRTAQLLKNKVDNTCKSRMNPHIIIMGDFNDSPSDKSLKNILEGEIVIEKPSPNRLYNLFLFANLQNEKIKSYKYRSKWESIDQFIVNGRLLNNKCTTHLTNKYGQVYSPDFLLEEDNKYGGQKPFRTYSGWNYLGGVSDHLPIYIDLYIKE